MNVVFLYSRVMPYTLHCLRLLVKSFGAHVHLVHYPVSAEAPYQLPPVAGITYYDQTQFSVDELIQQVGCLKPRFLFVSGWVSPGYLKVARWARTQSIAVIGGCDTPWRGDTRQRAAVLFSKYLIRRNFDYFMVAGRYQYEYARRLGFRRERILMPLYLAHTAPFEEAYAACRATKRQRYPKNILFVGRLETVKGIALLLEAFGSIADKRGWQLTVVGNGTLKEALRVAYAHHEAIVFKDFMQPARLVHEIAQAGAFCLPSTYEPWGVVIQEFAAAGLPLITSRACGAASVFVREGYNGYTHAPGDVSALTHSLKRLMALSEEALLPFSERSSSLAQALTPELFVSNFYQFLGEGTSAADVEGQKKEPSPQTRHHVSGTC